MSQLEDGQGVAFNRPARYRIRVLGLLDESWSERLGGFRIRSRSQKNQEGPVTELVGKVRDQAELLGLLNTLYNDLHLTLLKVKLEKAM
jgi:hypothetical protein